MLPPPTADSTLFARFRAAGLIPFGLTTVPEFGLALTSEPPGGPVARNPWDETLSPGGSSGGAAAAVAAGIVAIAHATDAAGSIRVPAACCGLVGLKPSRDATPAGPGFGNYVMGLASELVLARSVRDVAAAFDAVARPRPDPFRDQPRIARVTTPRAGPAQIAAVRAVAEGLAGVGGQIREIDPAPLDALGARAAAVARMVLSVSLAEWLDGLGVDASEVSPLAAAVAAEGRATPAPALFAAAREMARIGHEFRALFDDAEAILTPVLSGPPPRIGHFDMATTDAAAHFAAMEVLAPNATLANVAGTPALVLPLVTGDGELPVGVQLIGKLGSDRALLTLGAQLEAASPRPSFPYPVAGLPQ
jgi:amidase